MAKADDRVANIGSGDAPACQAQKGRLAANVERCRRERDGVSAPTAGQTAIGSCGVEATDASQKQGARAYCDALRAEGRASSELSQPIERCVVQAMRAAP
jgi:hypothetical protein